MSMSPTVVCNNILKRGFADGRDVTPMKLQKLMYFVACEYAKRTGKEMLSEDFGVWQYGPVLRTVYDEFKSYGKRPITQYAKDASGRSYAIDESTAPNLRDSIDYIWSKYRDLSGIALSQITHQDGSGWSRAFCERRPKITLDDMKADVSYGSAVPT